MKIELGDTASFNNAYIYYFDRDELEETTYATLTMDLDSPDDQVGTPDSTDIGFVRYTFTFIDTSQTATIKIDALRYRKSNRYGSISLTNIPTSTDPGVVARKLYRTVASGSEYLFLATLNDNTTTTYSDTTIDSALGVTTPPEIGFFNDNSPPPYAAIMKVNGSVQCLWRATL